MLSSRLNTQLKPALVLVIDENPSSSSVGFQFACAYAAETVNKFSKVHVLLTEHDEANWFHSHVSTSRPELRSKMHVVDLFDESHSTKSIEECLKTTDEKDLIVIESLPWLLLRTSEGDLSRLVHHWSQSSMVMAVVPADCMEESSCLRNLSAIAYITVRVKTRPRSESVEARIEQRSRTSVNTIKTSLTFSIDSQLNVMNLHEEKISNRKTKSAANTDGSAKTDVTANLTFNLRLKDDELTAKNNLVLPYTKQHTQATDDGCTIHYSYDKEDDIDEDEDEDLDMTDLPITTNNIRSDLVDTAIGFLKNSKVAGEPIEKKREFLQKKGLTDDEIDYAFKIIPQTLQNNQIVPNHRPSFLRRILSDLILAGLIGLAFKVIRRWFRSKQSVKVNDLNETIKNLQKTIQDMHASVKKLEQATDQLHLTVHTSSMSGSSSSLEEIKREIQTLKALNLSRSQFPAIPRPPPTLPAWQLEERKARSSPIPVEINPKTSNDDGDSIVVVSENGKRSDEENQLSISPSSASSSDA